MKILLPNGSIVLLNDAVKRLMICGWYPEDEDGKTYDYMGIFHPEGFVSIEYIFLFNHEDVKEVNFVGYNDSEFQVFAKRVTDELETRKNGET